MLDKLLTFLQIGSLLEFTAMLLAIAYLLLAIKQHRSCWYAAFVSTALYTYLFWDVSLLMESALNVFYMVMAVYGWWHWQRDEKPLAISRWSPQKHAVAVAVILLLSLVSGGLLEANTTAALPYLDSFTTWASVITTFMVANKVLENWLYWIVIDAASIYLYMDRGLNITAMLFVVYVMLAMWGYRQWLLACKTSNTN